MDCINCGRATMAQHPGGLLAIAHRADCVLYQTDDVTRAADYERTMRGWNSTFVRPMTRTEVELLQGAGYELPADNRETLVHIEGPVYQRTWPELGIGEWPEHFHSHRPGNHSP